MAEASNKRPKFVENFQDSEIAGSEFNQSQGQYAPEDDGQPIQLIRIRQSGKVQIMPKALDLICSCDLPVGFVCLAGKYRTGKSFLLNKLLYLDNKGFQVDPSTDACTQGIWMWSRPFINERQNNYIFFLDTEGSQSLSKGVNNDTIIFVLAVLLSSYFIYNSVGSIDQRSINQLNVVTKLSMNILAQQNMNKSDNEEVLYRFMPKFMWLLRDFTLELRDQEGRKQTSKQYMEDCLLEQNTLLRVNQDSRKIRRAIATNFKDRDCMTIVRPAKQQSDIRRLDMLPEHALRRQFIDMVNSLREKIMRQAGPKLHENTPLYGSSIASMLQSYVQAINNNSLPTIKTAWQHISEDEGAFAYNRALEVYNECYQQNFSEDQPKGQQIHKILITLRDETIAQFNRNITQTNQGYHAKLKQFLNQKEQAILDVNKQLNQFRNIEILKECAGILTRKLEANQYEDNPGQLNQDYQQVVTQYRNRAKGENKGQILSEFTTSMLPIILQMQKPKAPKENIQERNLEKEQYQKKIKLMEKRMISMQSQIKIAEDQKIRSAIKEQQKVKPTDPKKGSKKQKKGTGCCGGDGDCSIM